MIPIVYLVKYDAENQYTLHTKTISISNEEHHKGGPEPFATTFKL